MTIKLNIELSEKLEKHLTYLETISKRSKEFIIKEALIQYIEDMEDIQKLSVLEEIEGRKREKTYTSEELSKRLGI